MGNSPLDIKAVGHLNEDGVDESVSVALKFDNGRTASLSTSLRVKYPCEAHIVGTKGVLKVSYYLTLPSPTPKVLIKKSGKKKLNVAE